MPKEKARRVVVHDPTGFSFVSEGSGLAGPVPWAVFTCHRLPGQARRSFATGASASARHVPVVRPQLMPRGAVVKEIHRRRRGSFRMWTLAASKGMPEPPLRRRRSVGRKPGACAPASRAVRPGGPTRGGENPLWTPPAKGKTAKSKGLRR